MGYWRSREPRARTQSPPYSRKRGQDDAATWASAASPPTRGTEPRNAEKYLIHKKHILTSLSKLLLFTHTVLLRGTQESDFKSSLNWNVDVSKVSSGFRFIKLLLHSPLLTACPETIPGNSSKLNPIALRHLASHRLRLRKLRASLSIHFREEQSAFEDNFFLGFGLDPFAKFFISAYFGGVERASSSPLGLLLVFRESAAYLA